MLAQHTVPKHLFHVHYAGAAGNHEIRNKTKYINKLGSTYSFQINNFSLGIDYHFLFGYYQGIDLFQSLRTSEGMLISDNGSLINTETYFRGNQLHIIGGKMFPANSLTSFQFNIGLGFLHHFLHITTLDGKMAYLSKNNLKGYDQLSFGPSLLQELRINHFGEKQRINYYIQLFAQEAFMQNLRKYNYFEASADTKTHFNFIFGLQVGWLIPLFNQNDTVF